MRKNHKYRILVIDDDRIFRDTVSAVLKQAGFRIMGAVNGNEGLQICSENEIDIVITDIVMPDKEGIETIVELRNKYPEIKIIAMSGYPDLYLDSAITFGADRIIKKPFRNSEIISIVKELNAIEARCCNE